MAITGQDLYKYLQQKCNQDFTSFLGGTIKANRLFLDAFLAILENRFQGIESQKSRDEINYLIKTQQVFSLNNNTIYEAPIQISHITFQANTATITTYLPHNMVSGDQVTIVGVQASVVPTINNQFPVTVTKPNVFTIPFTWISGTYTVNTGTITTPKMIVDYWQMIQVNARYDVAYTNVSVTSCTNTTPIIITLDSRTDMREGMRVLNSGFLANTDANGDRYLKELNDFQFALYKDKFLQVPTVGVAGWTSSGTVSKVNYKVCKPFLPRTKISPLGQPTPDAPRWKDSQKQLIFYPLDFVASEITIDYYKQPDVVIDCGNNIIDLTLYYNQKFLMHLVDTAARLFAEPARDEVLYQQASANERQDN